jgi:hypothetical protein
MTRVGFESFGGPEVFREESVEAPESIVRDGAGTARGMFLKY